MTERRRLFEVFQTSLPQDLGPRSVSWFHELSAASTVQGEEEEEQEQSSLGAILTSVDDEHPHRKKPTPQRISRSLGVENYTDVSWTSSMFSLPCSPLLAGPDPTASSTAWPHLPENKKKQQIQQHVSKSLMAQGECDSQLCALDDSKELLLKSDDFSQTLYLVLMHLSTPKSQKTACYLTGGETNVHVKERQGEKMDEGNNCCLPSQTNNAKFESENNIREEPAVEAMTSPANPRAQLETFLPIAETPRRPSRLGVTLSGAPGALGTDARNSGRSGSGGGSGGSSGMLLLSSLGRRKSKFIYSVHSNVDQALPLALKEMVMGEREASVSFKEAPPRGFTEDVQRTPCTSSTSTEESLEIAKRQLSKTTCEYHPPRILNVDVAHVKRNTDRGSELPHGGKPQRAGGRLQGGANGGPVREALPSPGVAEWERLSPGSPDSRVRQETEESVIAWLQDEDTDLASPHHLAAPLTSEFPSLRAWAAPNAHQAAAKRPRHSESFHTGEPPLKRHLLSESDVGASAEPLPEPLLEPSVSSPDGELHSARRSCPSLWQTPQRHAVASQLTSRVSWRAVVLSVSGPVGCHSQPPMFLRTATQRQQGLAEGTASPSGAPHTHSHKAGAFLPPFRVSQPKALPAARGVRALSAGIHTPPSGGWFPGVAGRPTTLSGEPGVVGGDDQHVGGRCSPLTSRDGVGSAQWLARLESARMMQELRVSQKRGQAERALPGGLLAARGAAPARVSLRSAVGGGTPGLHGHEQLLRCGVSAGVTDVRADTAEAFRFRCEQHFSWRAVCGGSGFRLADGGLLVPDHVGTAGKEEFYKALLDTPGVDPGLVDTAWAYNHYRWLVWKLAAMEAAFPAHFAGRCLTPEVVLLQLKFRYDVEVDGSKRSAIRKIVERDDVASRTLVLLVSKLTGADVASGPGPPGSPELGLALELSDGWYALPVLLDAPLAALTRQGRVRVGHKLIVHGAELVGAQEACPPLEAPPSLALKICANSTRRARWDVRLGFYRNPGPFPLAVSSLLAHGGAVGCVDVVVLRVYPLQWMEKLASGAYVFRSERAEEREARRRSDEQQRALESLYARLENDLDERHKGRDRNKPRKSMAEIQALQDGAELYEAIRDSVDPCYVESCLSHEQARTLYSHRQGLADQKRTEMQAELRKALSSADGSSGGTQRDVCALWKLRVASYGDDRGRSHTAGNILSIWRPVPELHCLLREGLRFRIHHLAASQGRGHLDAGDVQLASSKKTKYQQMQASEALIGTIYQPRQAVAFFDLSLPDFWPPYSELDVVGIVISIQSLAGGGTQTVVLADEGRRLANVRIWGGLAVAAAEELVRPQAILAITNLQWRPAGAPRAGTATPVLFAGELSSFSLNPKEQHLRHRHSALRAAVPDVKSFVQEVEEKLLGPGAQLEEPSPGSGGRLQRSGGGLQRSGSSAAAARASPTSISPASINLVGPAPSTREKRKRSLSYLNGIHSPPPVSPLVATSTPVARRAFRAPRYANPPTILHIKPHAASPRPHTPPVSTPTNQSSSAHCEDEFPKDSVADEDLMMIDTQALLHKQTQGDVCVPYKSAVQENDASLDAAQGVPPARLRAACWAVGPWTRWGGGGVTVCTRSAPAMDERD
ncbi:unnamed protein product [Lampetra fluviatilis]